MSIDTENTNHALPAGAVSVSRQAPAFFVFIATCSDGLVSLLCGLALAAELVVILVNIAGRIFFQSPYQGTLELSVIALGTMAFVGGAGSYNRRTEIAMLAFVRRLSGRRRIAVETTGEVITLGFAVILATVSWQLTLEHQEERTAALGLPGALQYIPLALGMSLLSYYAARRLWARPGLGSLVSILSAVVLVGLVWVSLPAWSAIMLQGQTAVLAMLVVFIILIFLGLPIAIVLGATALTYSYTTGEPLQGLTLGVQNGATEFVLLALPFFVFAGYIMNEGGISQRLTDFVTNAIGHFRGGVLQVLIVTTFIVSGISGAKAADVAAVGIPMRSVVRKQGYKAEEAAAVLASSAAMGELVPPSIAMLIFGSITTVSTATLFMAGIVPAVLIAGSLMATVYVRARLTGRPKGQRIPLGQTALSGIAAVPALLMPLLLFGGILAGIGTPTEVSSFAVVYGILLSAVYRKMPGAALGRIAVDAAMMSGTILIILGTAAAFSRSLTAAGVPQELSAIMEGLPNWQFMLVTIVVIIVMGTFLEGLPALVVLAPLLLPVATQLGISSLAYAVVLLAGMGIGTFMPLVGIGYYVVTSVMEIEAETAVRPMLPYIATLVTGVIVVSFVPWISTALPTFLHAVGTG